MYRVDFLTCKGSDKEENNDALLLPGDDEFPYQLDRITGNSSGEFCGASKFFIADGMGGHDNASAASTFVLQRLSSFSTSSFQTIDNIRANCQLIHNEMISRAVTDGHKKPFGTALGGLIVANEIHYIINVGDVRVYGISNSVDLLTSDMRKLDGKPNQLTASFGGVRHQENISANILRLQPYKYGKYFVCSDGVHDILSDNILEKILLASSPNSIKLLENAITSEDTIDDYTCMIITIYP